MEKMLGNKKYILIFILPALLLFLGFTLIPLITSGVYSFFEYNGIGSKTFIGIKNYIELFTSDRYFPQAVKNSLILVSASLFIQLPISLILALILSKGVKGDNFFRTIYFIPVVISSMVIGQLWLKMFNSDYGVINTVIRHFVPEYEHSWLTKNAFMTVLIPSVWQYIGYHMIIFYAGIKSISTDYYEAAQMSLIDTDVKRSFATGIAGFSHVVDSLSAIKYAKVKAIRDEDGITTDFEIEGDFPRYGNDDDRADEIAIWLLKKFMHKLNKCHTYRHSVPTTSILTITSNVVYGKATGSLPDGRKAGEPLSPGANPSYGAEQSGLLASLNSVAKLPYELALDGISNTQTINPGALGHSDEERKENLAHVLDGYFDQGAHHLNVNVFGVDKLKDAMEHPEKPEYANFTIRVSGYAVKFIDLTREQQLDVIARTCHDHM